MLITHKSYIIERFTSLLYGLTLLVACAQISIPLTPVPISLQSIGVLLIGFSYKPKDTICIIASYILAGLCGAPIFAGYKGGIHMLYGPTAGYLFGYLISGWLVSMMKYRYNNLTGILITCLIANALIYLPGITWLALGLKMGYKDSLSVGFLPFIIPGIVKSIFLAKTMKFLGFYWRVK